MHKRRRFVPRAQLAQPVYPDAESRRTFIALCAELDAPLVTYCPEWRERNVIQLLHFAPRGGDERLCWMDDYSRVVSYAALDTSADSPRLERVRAAIDAITDPQLLAALEDVRDPHTWIHRLRVTNVLTMDRDEHSLGPEIARALRAADLAVRHAALDIVEADSRAAERYREELEWGSRDADLTIASRARAILGAAQREIDVA